MKIATNEDINKIVGCEISNRQTHPMLYEYVKKPMMPGPSNLLNTIAFF